MSMYVLGKKVSSIRFIKLYKNETALGDCPRDRASAEIYSL